MNIRVLDLSFYFARNRLRPRRCAAPGCAVATREGRDYCSDHVEQQPYVQALLAKLEERELQDDRVKSTGPKAVDLSGITSREILQHLAFHGPRTEERLCRELDLDLKTLSAYVSAMRDKGLVRLGQTKRGSTVVKLVKRRIASAEPARRDILVAVAG